MTASSVKVSGGSSWRGSDSMTWYLASIGREPLLTPAEEIELGCKKTKNTTIPRRNARSSRSVTGRSSG